MPKAGVLSVSPYSICQAMELKRLFLMYDKIFIDTDSLEIARMTKDPISNYPELFQVSEQNVKPGNPKILILGDLLNLNRFEFYEDNFRNIDYLKEIGFIVLRKVLAENVPCEEQAYARYSELLYELNENYKELNSPEFKEFIQQFSDAKARIMCLSGTNEAQPVPILLNYPNNPKLGINTQVCRFLIQQFPEPDDTVSWDQLLDFKNDPDTMAKYYALIDWMNEITRKDYKLYEIQDKFRHLYHQYDEQYKLHKIKSKRGILELLFTASIDFLAGNLGFQGLSTNLFSLSRMTLNLMEAEQRFVGREVGYIQKINRIFKEL